MPHKLSVQASSSQGDLASAVFLWTPLHHLHHPLCLNHLYFCLPWKWSVTRLKKLKLAFNDAEKNAWVNCLLCIHQYNWTSIKGAHSRLTELLIEKFQRHSCDIKWQNKVVLEWRREKNCFELGGIQVLILTNFWTKVSRSNVTKWVCNCCACWLPRFDARTKKWESRTASLVSLTVEKQSITSEFYLCAVSCLSSSFSTTIPLEIPI